jgi:phage/plasmid primase-like uncharacterized protein
MLHNFNDRLKNKQDFRLAIINTGLTPPEEIIDNGQIQRFSTNGKRGNKDGWYVLHSDGIPNGLFGCWRTNIEKSWQANIDRPYSPEEAEYLKNQTDQSFKQRKIERENAINLAKIRTQSIWDKSVEVIDHPYLKNKGIKPYIAMQYGKSLVIPMYRDGMLATAQFIDEEGNKHFVKDGPVAGSYSLIGSITESATVCICEGYATAASIHEATSHPVVIAFHSGNLPKVAKIFWEKHPNISLIIAGDDDFHNENNPGKKSASEAAEVTQSRLIFPTFTEPRLHYQTDFNDMAQAQGTFAVYVAFDDAMNSEPLGPKKFSLTQFSLNGQSEAMKKKMLEDKYILGRLAVLGQFIVFYAAPNVGKTLLTLWLIIQAIIKKEINPSDVFYINADDNHNGLTFKLTLAEEHGFHMLAPGYNGFDSAKLFEYINTMIREDSARRKIIVLDTLKKFTDIMRKDVASKFTKVMREFVSHGGTIICLGHVNKHKNADGKSIYGGTSDIPDDVDCYYMIEEVQSTEKTKTVRFENKKDRGKVAKTATFIYSNGNMNNYQELLDTVITLSDDEAEALVKINEANKRLDANKEVMDAIKAEIEAGNTNKTELIKAVSKQTLVSRSKVKKVLDDHTGTNYKKGHRWNFTVKDKNCHIYSLINPNDEDTYRRQM